jgi:hypothetical protein
MNTRRVLVTTASLGSPLTSEWCAQNAAGLEIVFQRISENTFPLRTDAMHPRLQAKIPKMLAWDTDPGFDYYVWLDSTFSIVRPDAVQWIVNYCDGVDVTFFKHSKRSSVREELAFMQEHLKRGDRYLEERYHSEPLAEQVAHYLQDPAFEDSVLFECGVFVYSSQLVKNRNTNVLKEWFYQNCRWSLQDQLSLPYALSKIACSRRVFDTTIFDKPYFEYRHRISPSKWERLASRIGIGL